VPWQVLGRPNELGIASNFVGTSRMLLRTSPPSFAQLSRELLYFLIIRA
jgi:hypothetical protein